jgi:transient receptor potential cation channel subfamily M protein 2
MKSIYSHWALPRPKLILSVTGGAKNFTIPHRIKKAFKEGLVKAAASTGAWIITGGTNAGVMRLVGEAVADEYPKYSTVSELVVLGIATWGSVAMRNKLLKNDAPVHYARDPNNPEDNKETKDVLLDTNHNNFILVDDGTVGRFGREIDFRADFEDELTKSGTQANKVPTVLIVVNGGEGTIKTVAEAIKNDVPVLVLSVRCLQF